MHLNGGNTILEVAFVGIFFSIVHLLYFTTQSVPKYVLPVRSFGGKGTLPAGNGV